LTNLGRRLIKSAKEGVAIARKVAPFDAASHLDNPEVIAHYLVEALRTRDSKLIQCAICNVMRAYQKKPAPAVYSIREFCEAHGISRTLYFKLRDAGKGPREMQLGSRIVISLEAAAAWRRAQER